MSDDIWRGRRDDDDFSEFGSLFDDAEPTANLPEVQGAGADVGDDSISFGDSDTGSLPHWTEPPTGEIPRFDAAAIDAHETMPDEDPDLDVWSSFSSEAPIWKDDEAPVDPVQPTAQTTAVPGRRSADGHSAEHRTVEHRITDSGSQRRVTGESAAGRPRAQPHHDRYRPVGHAPPATAACGATPRGPCRRSVARTSERRHQRAATCPAAIAVGLLMAAVFIGALMFDPRAAAAVVVVILGLAAVEFYDKVTREGVSPGDLPGHRRPAWPRRSSPTGSASGRCRWSSRLASWRPPAASSAPAASKPAPCRTCRSRRSASCGSVCSVRSLH